MSQERSAEFYRGLKFTSAFFLGLFIMSAVVRYQKGESCFISLLLILNSLKMISMAMALENAAIQRERAVNEEENPDADMEFSPSSVVGSKI